MILYAHLTDNELIDKISNGNTACFEVLIRRHSQSLYRLGRALGYNFENLERIIADVHFSAFLHLGKFNFTTPYRNWLQNTMVGKCRVQQNIVERKKQLSYDMDEPAGIYVNTLAKVHTNRTINKTNILEEIIESLPVAVRTVFLLAELEGLSEKAASELMNITEVQANIRLAKAWHSLAQFEGRKNRFNNVYVLDNETLEGIVFRTMERIDTGIYVPEYNLVPRN